MTNTRQNAESILKYDYLNLTGETMNLDFQQRFLNARSALIENTFLNLNDMQRQAVMTTSGPLLILAGAGSGKTTVLINRIANLIRFGVASDSGFIPDDITEEDVLLLEAYLSGEADNMADIAESLCILDPVVPWSILAITFTNKAANELKERLVRMLGSAGEDIWAMTFHSACCRILRKDIDRLGYTSNFTIYDTADSERVMKDVIKEMRLDEKVFSPKLLLSLVSNAKDKMQTPLEFEQAAAASGDFRMEKAAEAYEKYQTRLKEANALDFDDIILLTVRLLQECPDILGFYQNKFRYILVDEYQDTNHLQYLLTSLLAKGHNNICVVGDDDQSIYKFRGATIRNILDFERQYTGAKLIRLEQNYRSTQYILNAANGVIAHNSGRKGKKLWTENGTGEKIRIYEAANEADEAQYVANTIFEMVKEQQYKDFAILYRTNAQSNALENAFKRNGIPYRIIGGTRFFDRAEVKDMLAYLSVINNRGDDLRLRRIINNPPRGIGSKTIEVAERQAAAENICLYSLIADAASYGPLEKAEKKLSSFVAMIEDLAALLDTEDLGSFYDQVLIRTGYLAMLQEKDDTENRVRAENILELKSSIVAYMESHDNPSLSGFLEEIALYTDIEQYDAEADAVVMMTMHSAKGLEFPNVFLVGFEAGLFPNMKSEGSHEDMEEERRLCYVAITRAKERLMITYARQRMLYGQTTYGRPSRFINELPENCVIGRKPVQPRPESTYIPARSNMYGDFDSFSSRPAAPRKQNYSAFSKSKQTSSLDLKKGDMVLHKAFGKGMVLSVLPMGNDALLEIAFDQIGTKRLMERAASVHLTKL